jgi:hypothetical protein
MFALRNLRYRSCTGDIQLSFNDNNRKDSSIGLYQTIGNPDNYEEFQNFEVSIVKSPFILVKRPIEWYDSSSSVPPNSRLTYKDCPFPEEWRGTSSSGQMTSFWIFGALALSNSLVAAFVYFRYYRSVTWPDVPTPILLSTQDMAIFLTSLFEPLQFLIIAPAQDLINLLTIGLLKNAVWTEIDFSDGMFWKFTNSLLAIYGFWLLVLGAVVFLKVLRQVIDLPAVLLLLLRPLNFVFLFTLLTTFDCNEGYGEFSVDEALMDVDCYETCWEGRHLRYSIIAAVVIVSYSVLSLCSLNYLSFILDGHQFVSTPSFLISRTAVQVVLICLFKSRRVLGSAWHSGLHLSVLSVYVLIISLKKSLNVPTLNLWHRVVHVIVLYLSLLAVLHEFLYPSNSQWSVLFLIGVALLVIGGKFKANRLPKLVLSPPKIDESKLFAFAFRRSKGNMKLTFNTTEAKVQQPQKVD